MVLALVCYAACAALLVGLVVALDWLFGRKP
jgi:flagellar biosynthesis protein FliQ